jgi:FkbH-like protein
MKEWSLKECSWLPEAPRNFRDQCAAIRNSTSDSTSDLYRLAQHRLNSSQLNSLAATLSAVQKNFDSSQLKNHFRLGLVSNATIALFVPALKASALRYGIYLEVVEAEFGQVMQEALDPDSPINRADLDAVLLALDYRGLPFPEFFKAFGRSDVVTTGNDDAVDYISMLREKFSAGGKRAIIVQTLPAPPETLFGSYEYRLNATMRRQTEKFNSRLADISQDSAVLLLDIAGLANRIGLDQWNDPMQWNLAKLPFAQNLVPIYTDYIARLLGAIRGQSRKCLVLDLDNTLWGGVIGDDGVDGISVGQGNALAEAFLEIQRTALNLRSRGVVLAVCSKNEDETARLPFKHHPEMLIKEEHIAVFQANWIDKASNLETIAKTLNIGLDALVLLDDNPAERAQVREALPQVAVPELPEDPSFYPRALLSAGYFEAVGYTPDDQQRAEQYQANSQRSSLQGSSRNLDEFLQSLAMVAKVDQFNQQGRGRIVQLINKTNQFNLTTRRYTEAEVVAMEEDPSIFTLQLRLQDRFGDNGMISVIVCRTVGKQWNIDVWLMSCRVLKRRVEEFVLAQIVQHAREQGITTLQGEWIPSNRNDLVKDHYANLGFSSLKEEDGSTFWQLEVKDYQPDTPPIMVK